MKNILLLTLILFIFSCDLDIVPDDIENGTVCDFIETPVAKIITNATTCEVSDCTISFDASTSTNACTYQWDVDGNLSTIENETASFDHTLITVGLHTITLWVENNDAEIHSTQVVINVVDPNSTAVTAFFSVDSISNNNFAPAIAYFKNESNNATSYEWDFGDGSAISTEETPEHIFSMHGNFMVKLTASNGTNTQLYQDEISIQEMPDPPVADFEISNMSNNYCAPTTINFNNTSTDANEYEWDFGDPSSGSNNTSNSLNASHLYSSVGNYLVTLTIRNSITEIEDVATQEINITSPTFVKYFGGVDYENGRDLIQTSNRGYAIFGTSSSFTEDMYLVFTDKNGNKINSSELTYGGSGNSDGHKIIVTNNGYALVGSSTSGGNAWDMNLILIDEDGNELSSNTYGGTTSEYGNSIVQSSNGNFAILGSITSSNGLSSSVSLVITESDGTKITDKSYLIGNSNLNYGYDIIPTANGYALLCYSVEIVNGLPIGRSTIIFTDTNGTKLDEYQYGSMGLTIGTTMIETNDGGFAIIGNTTNNAANGRDVYFLHIDATGAIVNSKTYGGPADDYGGDIIQRTDGSFVIIGSTESVVNADSDMYLIFTDANGNEVSSKTFGGNDVDYGSSIIQTEDGGLGLFGTTSNSNSGRDFFFVKTDADGNL